MLRFYCSTRWLWFEVFTHPPTSAAISLRWIKANVSDEEKELFFDHLCCSAVLTDMFEQDHRALEFTGPTTRPTTTLPVDSSDGSSEVFRAALCMFHIHFPCLFKIVSCFNQCRSLFLTVLIISWHDQSAHKPKAQCLLCQHQTLLFWFFFK